MLKAKNTKVTMISPYSSILQSRKGDSKYIQVASSPVDKAKAERYLRFRSWDRSWEMGREMVLFKESTWEGGKEEEVRIVHPEETMSAT